MIYMMFFFLSNYVVISDLANISHLDLFYNQKRIYIYMYMFKYRFEDIQVYIYIELYIFLDILVVDIKYSTNNYIHFEVISSDMVV